MRISSFEALLFICGLGVAAPASARRSAEPPPKAAAVGDASDDDGDDEKVEELDVEKATVVHEDLFGDAYPSLDRTFDLLNAHMLRAHTFGTLIAHRNSEGILQSPFYDLLGFDGGGLKVDLGLRYGILDDLDVGVLRQNGTIETWDTWEFDLRYRVLAQSRGMPFDFAFRLGIDWYNGPGTNATGIIGQALLTHLLAGRALLGGGVLYAYRSSGPTKSDNDALISAAIALQADVRVATNLSLAAEYVVNIAGFHEAHPVITFGPKIISNRHTFSFVVSNTQYMTADSVLANTYRSGWKKWVLGFHITREIEL